jgi:hypothetical protein
MRSIRDCICDKPGPVQATLGPLPVPTFHKWLTYLDKTLRVVAQRHEFRPLTIAAHTLRAEAVELMALHYRVWITRSLDSGRPESFEDRSPTVARLEAPVVPHISLLFENISAVTSPPSLSCELSQGTPGIL